jgi:LCP family protein required for cell wall assembly
VLRNPDAPVHRERRPRWQRVLGYLCVVISLLMAVVLVGGYFEYRSLNGSIDRPQFSPGQTGVTPTRTVVGAQNWLIMGSDTRQGKGNDQYGRDVLGARSDTVILAHIARGAKSATLVSIPRDSYVQIPACKETGGSSGMSAPQMNKFNAAYSIGGPACTIKTVQSLTHIAIDHWVVLDFEGFQQIVNALGGVSVCLSKPINDPVRTDPLTGGKIGSGLIAHAGVNNFDGKQALAFVRSRYAVGDGSDLDRIKDQQTFISAVIRKVTSVGLLLDPPKLLSVARAAVHSLAVDKGMSLARLADFAHKLHSLPPSKVRLLTVPLSSTTASESIGGVPASVVLWDTSAADALWAALRNDTSLPGRGGSHASGKQSTSHLTVPPSQITVNVLNGTSQNGLAHTAAQALANLGYTIGTVGDATSPVSQTEVQYGPSRVQSSQTLAASVDGGATRVADNSLGDSVNLVLGSDYSGLHQVTIASPSASPSPSSSSLSVTNAKADTCAIG